MKMGLGWYNCLLLLPLLISFPFAGDTPMNDKSNILIVYATRSGSTAEVAQAIAEEFKKRGAIVDVHNAKDKPTVKGYTAVVVGSSIRFGSWLPEAIDWIKANKEYLSNVPVAFFNCGIFIVQEDPKKQAEVEKYNNSAKAIVTPVAEANFAGKIDMNKLGFIDKNITKAIGVKDGDKRDYATIRQWAQELYPRLTK
jgi:menaquinone-dependent protoporphyrinogen oxidase